MSKPIKFTSKKGDRWRQLSCFSPAPFELDGERWATAEHYYQAQKTTDPAEQEKIRGTRSAADARRTGRKVPLRGDWNTYRDAVMARALRAKFAQHEESRRVLLSTKRRRLIEDAPWDRYWGGTVRGSKDRLGQMLMEIRAEWMAKQ